MKRFLLSFALLASQICTAQWTWEWIYKGTYLSAPVALDSVLVENLTRGGYVVVSSPNIMGADSLVVYGSTDVGIGVQSGSPGSVLLPNYPNPFDEWTTFGVSLLTQGELSVDVYDATGSRVAGYAASLPDPGLHTFGFRGGRPGVYFVHATVDGKPYALRMVQLGGDARPELNYEGTRSWEGLPKDGMGFIWVSGDQVRHTVMSHAISCGPQTYDSWIDVPMNTANYQRTLEQMPPGGTPCLLAEPDTLDLQAGCVGDVAILSFTLAGENLVCTNITIGPVSGFLFGFQNNGPWTPSINVGVVNNTVATTPIWVRFDPTDTTDVVEDLLITCQFAQESVTLTGSVLNTGIPDAGNDGGVIVCSNEIPFDLYGILGGTPDAAGTWTDQNNNAHSGNFDPATDPGGTFMYVVGGGNCMSDTALATVAVHTAPYAGTDGSITVCSDEGLLDLFQYLGGNPESGGIWIDPNGNQHTGTFDSFLGPSGAYIYIRQQLPPCAADSATVTVTVVQAPNAGMSVSITLCDQGGSVDLLLELDDSPDPGGTWEDPDGNPHSGTFVPGTSMPGTYTYMVPGSGPCADAVATVEVVVTSSPFAGNDTTAVLCDVGPDVDLIELLGGTPDPGGTWTDPNGDPYGDTFTPGTSSPGTYTYTLSPPPPCSSDEATVTISSIQAPNAGIDYSINICLGDQVALFFSGLGSTAQDSGVWSGPSQLSVVPYSWYGTFSAGFNQPGVYTYTVLGEAPCPLIDSATVTVTVPMPNAGMDGDTTVCENGNLFDLFSLLGVADTTGIWNGPGQLGGGHAGIYTPGMGQEGQYIYTVEGDGCPDDYAYVFVQEVSAPYAGMSSMLEVCEQDPLQILFDTLGAGAGVSGIWTGPSTLDGGWQGFFTPGTHLPGLYTYTVTNACGSDDATVTVDVPPPTLQDTNGDTLHLSGPLYTNMGFATGFYLNGSCLDEGYPVVISGPPNFVFSTGGGGPPANPYSFSHPGSLSFEIVTFNISVYSQPPGWMNATISISCAGAADSLVISGEYLLPLTCPGANSVTDTAGNTYGTVQIAGRCWTTENLRTTHYANGDPIPNETDSAVWVNLHTTETGAWCNYDNDPGYDEVRGKLYNGYAAMDSRGVCPTGWHVPTELNWQELELAMSMPSDSLNVLGGWRGISDSVACKLKADTLWATMASCATNASGFTGLPGGIRDLNQQECAGLDFCRRDTRGCWWSSTFSTESQAQNPGLPELWLPYYRELGQDGTGVFRAHDGRKRGMSIRCVQD